MSQLVLNRVFCKACGKTIMSMHRHDYVLCGCPNETMADGGTDYIRCGGKDMTLVEPRPVYLSDGFDLCRGVPIWGTRGKDGDKPLRYISLSEMSDGHIRAIVDVYEMHQWRKKLFEEELEYRKKQNISIQDAR